MRTSLFRLLVVVFAAGLVAGACASDSGSVWTFAPVTAEADEVAASPSPLAPAANEPDQAATAEPEPAPAEPTSAEPVPTVAPEPADARPEPARAEPAAPALAEDGARVIELESTASLLFLQDGERIPDIAVTPDETVRFRIDNTAGFAHNFYIGEDSVLSVPLATTEVGIGAWERGVRELEWVVPDDVAGLMFGCTIPGHYFTQQGTFSVAP